MNRQTAVREAKRVSEYWAAKGVTIAVRLVSTPIPDEIRPKIAHSLANVWGIRTDLKNGMPRPPQAEPRLPMIRKKASLK